MTAVFFDVPANCPQQQDKEFFDANNCMTKGIEGCRGCILDGESEIETIHHGDLVVFDPKAIPKQLEPVVMLSDKGVCDARLYNEPLRFAKELAIASFVRPDNLIGVIVASLTLISQVEQ